MPESQRRRLDEIGFVWDADVHQFEQMYAALVEYKNAHGDCVVPSNWSANPRLGGWVKRQRAKGRKHSDEQLRKLNDLGFVWDVGAFKFDQRYAALVACRKANRAGLVAGYGGDRQLAAWVCNVRKRRDKLTEEQIQRLDDIGFVWRVGKGQ